MSLSPEIKKVIFTDTLCTQYKIDTSLIKQNDQSLRREIILIGYKKAVDEISSRNDRSNSWFHIKFLIIGAILSVLGYSVFKKRLDGIKDIIEWDLFYMLIGICALISFSIDIQIRQNVLVTNQLGLWISQYIEPLVNKGLVVPEHYLTSSHTYIGWEQFLRISGTQKGFQMDPIYSLTFWPASHILTWILYISYLILGLTNQNSEKNHKIAKQFLFFSIHISIILFAIMGTSLPNILRINIKPFGRELFVKPMIATSVFVCMGILIALIYWCSKKLYKSNKTN